MCNVSELSCASSSSAFLFIHVHGEPCMKGAHLLIRIGRVQLSRWRTTKLAQELSPIQNIAMFAPAADKAFCTKQAALQSITLSET